MKNMYNFKNFSILEWEENDGRIPKANWISYMDTLYKEIKTEIVPNIPKDFKVNYSRGKKIIIHTDNEKDLVISIEIADDKISYSVKPVKGVEFEFNFSFSNDTSQIIKNIVDEFENDPNKGLSSRHQIKKVDSKPKKNQNDDIDHPITKKPIKKKKSIDIDIIKEVLEDAYIVDDIDMKEITIEELVRRMLIETRKRESNK